MFGRAAGLFKVRAISPAVMALMTVGAAHAQSAPTDNGVEIVLETPETSAVGAPVKPEEDTTFLNVPADGADDFAVTDTTVLPPSSRQGDIQQPSTPSSPAPVVGGGPVSGVGMAVGGSAVDSGTLQRIVDRMVQSGVLENSADAQDPALFDQAVRAYQRLVGIAETGNLDRDTVGRFLAP